MGSDSIIAIDAIWTQYGDMVIHRDLSLSVHCGEVIAIIGGSGSGKSTLLRLMLGLEAPARGTIKVFGVPLNASRSGALQQVRNRWGVLFQDGALFSALSVFDNVALPLRELKALPSDVIRELVMRKLDLVEIDTMSINKMPAELSGGMVKRVALARALALDPELLLLDEPTAGLDPERSHGFVKLIESLRRALNLTVVMATHDVETLMALSDTVAVLANQGLLTIGPLWEIVKNPDPFVQNFFLGNRQRCEHDSVMEFRGKLAEASVS